MWSSHLNRKMSSEPVQIDHNCHQCSLWLICCRSLLPLVAKKNSLEQTGETLCLILMIVILQSTHQLVCLTYTDPAKFLAQQTEIHKDVIQHTLSPKCNQWTLEELVLGCVKLAVPPSVQSWATITVQQWRFLKMLNWSLQQIKKNKMSCFTQN